jgi:hypothetical protein
VHARSKHTKEEYLKVLPWLTPSVAIASTADLEDADLVFIERRVPTRMGKWRLVPRGVE